MTCRRRSEDARSSIIDDYPAIQAFHEALAAKGEVIASKDETIWLPTTQVDELKDCPVLIGLNEAIVVQQLHYEWQSQLPFWSNATLQRIIGVLEEKGIAVATDRFNQSKVDRTKWYAIDYDALDHLLESADDLLKMSNSTGQLEQVDDVNLSNSIPEINQETTTEKNGTESLRRIHAERRQREQADWLKRKGSGR